jgi:hypothetical protein
MRGLVLGLVLLGLSAGASGAQQGDLDKCAQTEAWFMLAIESRQAGQSKTEVRRTLRGEMERKAADELTDFIFDVPRSQLSPVIARAVRQQCEQM